MDVATLIGLLSELDGSTLVVMSKDGEGNGYSPLADAASHRYIPESTWSGYLLDEDDPDEDGESVPVACLWPVN